MRYLRAELKTDTLPADLVEALRRLQDPVDGILIAPFYLDLLVRLRNAGVSFERLPEHRDRSRAAVLAMYLHSIASGRISVPPNGDDVGSPEQRGRDATAATEVVARRLIAERARFAVALKDVEIEDRPLRDAVDLHLLARGAERVGFAVDDIGAYLVAATLTDVGELLGERRAGSLSAGSPASGGADRHVLSALVVWRSAPPGAGRHGGLETLLTAIEDRRWTRPVIVATAVRIASGCELDGVRARHRCRRGESLHRLAREPREAGGAEGAPASDRVAQAGARPRRLAVPARPPAPLAPGRVDRERRGRMARREGARAARGRHLGDPAAHPSESCLATGRGAPGGPGCTIPDDSLGNQIGSLAWILPVAARRTDAQAEGRFKAVADLCLAQEMSPLRGEMFLAAGLRLAVVGTQVPCRGEHRRRA